ncbi:MAG: hypothetical protein WCX46_01030 [Candidatus Paceibacterota bacterium]
MKYFNKGGISIVGILLLGVILVLVLSYFNINIKATVEKPTTQENINYIKGSSINIWNDYLKEPTQYFWNEIWLKIFWASFISNMERIRDNEPTDMQKAAPQVDFN